MANYEANAATNPRLLIFKAVLWGVSVTPVWDDNSMLCARLQPSADALATWLAARPQEDSDTQFEYMTIEYHSELLGKELRSRLQREAGYVID